MKGLSHKNRAASAGFSLFELLLVVGLLALLVTGLYQLFDSWLERAVNRTAAGDMMRVQNAAQDYVLTNFDTLKTGPVNTFTPISAATISGAGFLPSGFQPVNVFKQAVKIYRRTLRVQRRTAGGALDTDALGNPIYIYSIEVVTVSDNPASGTLRIPNKRLIDIAQAGGPKMGVVSNMVMGGTTFTGRATSLYSDWFVPLSDLAAAGYTASPNATGGYAAAYGIVNNENTDTNDNWLYRVTINGKPELNRMAADLRMGGNRLESVGTVVADKVSVTGNAAFLGQSSGVTSDSAQAMTVEQALRVDGSTESRINMKSGNAGCSLTDPGTGNRTLAGSGCSITGGELQVLSPASAANNATMNLGTLTADGSVITDLTSVGNTTDARGRSTFTSVTGSALTNYKQLVSPDVTVTGASVITEQMQTGNLGVTAGSNVYGQIAAARLQPGNGHSVASSQMSIANTATFNNNIQANGMNATQSLYIKNAQSYYDSVRARWVICTVVGSRTYCEPNGATTWGNGDVETCYANTYSGYSCDWWRAGNYLGRCYFNRTTGASGQAYHSFAGCS